MAGTATYTVVLGANVLYPIAVIDLIVSLAETNLFHARWSDSIEAEAARNLAEKRPELADKMTAGRSPPMTPTWLIAFGCCAITAPESNMSTKCRATTAARTRSRPPCCG